METVKVVMTYPDGTTKVQEFDYNDETDLVVSQIRKSDIAIKQQRDFLHNLPVFSRSFRAICFVICIRNRHHHGKMT